MYRYDVTIYDIVVLCSVLAHMYADRGACVSSCGEGRMNVGGICQDCEGPCPRSMLVRTYQFSLQGHDQLRPTRV